MSPGRAERMESSCRSPLILEEPIAPLPEDAVPSRPAEVMMEGCYESNGRPANEVEASGGSLVGSRRIAIGWFLCNLKSM